MQTIGAVSATSVILEVPEFYLLPGLRDEKNSWGGGAVINRSTAVQWNSSTKEPLLRYYD